MNRSSCVIDIGEEGFLWQGRPAPRCYTLRHWRHALVWAIICVFAGAWQAWIWLTLSADAAWVVPFLPVPLLLAAFVLSLGRLVCARLEWEHVFYIMSNTSVWIQRGRKKRVTRYLYAELNDVRLELYRNNSATGLGWVHAQFGTQKVTLECLEDAQEAYTILSKHLYSRREKKAKQRCENKR
jgi:hypothetical protein